MAAEWQDMLLKEISLRSVISSVSQAGIPHQTGKNHLFLDLALCPGALSYWGKKIDPCLNSGHKIGGTQLSKIPLYPLSFKIFSKQN